MTIDEKVTALLNASAGVTALVPVGRIKPPGDWQNLPRPYIVHQSISPVVEYSHSGRVPLTEWDYQVDAFGDSYSTARALSLAIRDALEGTHDEVTFFWTGWPYQWEWETKIHHFSVTFTCHEAL